MIADVCLMVWAGDPSRSTRPRLLRAAPRAAGLAFPTYRLAVERHRRASRRSRSGCSIDRTRLGAMIRAGVDDPAMARVTGIRVSRLFTIVFCLGAGARRLRRASSGGPILSVYPGLDRDAAAGPRRRDPRRQRQPAGRLAGSLIVGFLYNFGQAMFPELAYVVLFLPMLIVLVRAAAGPVRAAGGVKPAASPRRSPRSPPPLLWLGNTSTSTSRPRSSSTRSSPSAINVLVGLCRAGDARPRRPLRRRRRMPGRGC